LTDDSARPNESLGGKLVAHTVTPVLTALMLPTAKVVGEGVAALVRQKFDQWDAVRREANLKAHLERNRPRLEEAAKRPPGDDYVKLLPKWVEAVEEVGAEDSDLSAAWDRVLESILEGDSLASILLDTLRSLSPAEVAELLKFKGKRSYRLPRGTLHDEILQRLAAKGVLRGQSLWLAYAAFSIFMIACLSLYSVFRPSAALTGVGGTLVESANRLGGDTFSQLLMPASVAVFLAFVSFGYYFAGYTYRVYFLTRLGRQLVATAPSRT